MKYILEGDPKEVEKVIRENRIRVERGQITFTLAPEEEEIADDADTEDVVLDDTKEVDTDDTEDVVEIDDTKDVDTDDIKDVVLDDSKDVNTDDSNDVVLDDSNDVVLDDTKAAPTKTSKRTKKSK